MSVKEVIVRYEEFYMDRYGKKPSESLINRFCTVNNLKLEEQEEVAKVEEQAEYEVCSVLQDIPTMTTDGTCVVKPNRVRELLNILEQYRDKLSPSDASKLQEIEREMEGSNDGSGVECTK